jgi:hypothetical protein
VAASTSLSHLPRRRLFQRAWDRLRHVNWRVWAVLAAVVVCLIVTAIPYYYHLGLDPTTHFGAVFAGWVGGVALFVIAGAVVAIVSLARPEEDSFDARARILFRHQTGKHIDYIIHRISSILEQYTESHIHIVRIQKYHEPSRTFYVIINNETNVRSYIEDVQSHYEIVLDYKEVTLPPETGEIPNILTFIRVEGKPLVGRHVFSDSISHRELSTVKPNASSKAECELSFWIRANDEENSVMCVRYTQFLTVYFENVTDRPITIEFQNLERNRWDKVIIEPVESPKPILTVTDLMPDVNAFVYRILAP